WRNGAQPQQCSQSRAGRQGLPARAHGHRSPETGACLVIAAREKSRISSSTSFAWFSLWAQRPSRLLSRLSLWPEHLLLPEFDDLLWTITEFHQDFLIVLTQEGWRTANAGWGFREFEGRVGHAQLRYP